MVKSRRINHYSLQKMHPQHFTIQIESHYKAEKCHLNYEKNKPWTLLFAVILSAQCTDKKVNQITPILFTKFPTLEHFAAKPIEELETIIHPLGFYRNKSKSLHKCAEQLLLNFNGILPDTMEDLTSLAGVGRKTSNVILWNIFEKNVGFVVDTHIGRIAQRVGLTKQKTPEKIEQDLMRKLPQDKWGVLSHELIQFGRELCRAPVPVCSECFLREVCPKVGVLKEK